jgi:hypothetical protein
MKLIVKRLDSLDSGAHLRHPLAEFELVCRSNDVSTLRLENGKANLPSGDILEVQASYTPENRAVGLSVRLNGERVFTTAFECEWLPCSFEMRISETIALGFYVLVESDDSGSPAAE